MDKLEVKQVIDYWWRKQRDSTNDKYVPQDLILLIFSFLKVVFHLLNQGDKQFISYTERSKRNFFTLQSSPLILREDPAPLLLTGYSFIPLQYEYKEIILTLNKDKQIPFYYWDKVIHFLNFGISSYNMAFDNGKEDVIFGYHIKFAYIQFFKNHKMENYYYVNKMKKNLDPSVKPIDKGQFCGRDVQARIVFQGRYKDNGCTIRSMIEGNSDDVDIRIMFNNPCADDGYFIRDGTKNFYFFLYIFPFIKKFSINIEVRDYGV